MDETEKHVLNPVQAYAPPESRVADDWRVRRPSNARRFWLTCLGSAVLIPLSGIFLTGTTDSEALIALFLVICWALPTGIYLWPHLRRGDISNLGMIGASLGLFAGTLLVAIALWLMLGTAITLLWIVSTYR